MTTVVVIEATNAVASTETVTHVITEGRQGPRGIQGIPGPAGSGGGISLTADTALGGHKLVACIDAELIYADNRQLSHASQFVGMTTHAADAGSPIQIINFGEFEEPTWNWTLGQPIYLGINGQLTQVEPQPSTAAFALVVGFPLSPTRVLFKAREPIALT
jgi:hypothetical protein